MIAALALLAPALGCAPALTANVTGPIVPSFQSGRFQAKVIPASAPAKLRTTEGGQMCILVPNLRPVPMPLEKTSVRAEIAGMGARTTVIQTFKNPSATPIEAIYTFPLPDGAAVDRMRIRIGERVIEAEIRRREDARKIYDDAKNRGQAAALLDKETGDVFTQSVANIRPGETVEVEISYVELLKFEGGEFEYAFPMVVGPRYTGTGTQDPEKLSPPRARTGTDVDVRVALRAGAPITGLSSVLHEVTTSKRDARTVEISLAKKNEIPNRDFILKYRTTSKAVQEALFTHWDPKTGGHFALVLAPPASVAAEQRAPKEMMFVVDQSVSQSGFPIEKSRELSLKLIDTLGPNDRFNVMGFSDRVNPLWPGPRSVTSENLQQARTFVKGLEANGGTQLERAIVASMAPAPDPERVRVVLFNTDGLAGQESVILGNIREHRGAARLFTFGIGNSVNRGLISAMSREGRGADEVVTLASDSDDAVTRLAGRLESPVLVNPAASFAGGSVTDVVPNALPDVFAAKPVILYGRYTKPGRTTLTLTGRTASGPFSREIEVNLPEGSGDGSSVASLWARAKIADVQNGAYAERQIAGAAPEVADPITSIALAYRLVTETTSFVAVDRDVRNPGGAQETVRVPVENPDGMREDRGFATAAAPMSVAPGGGGIGGGGGFGGAGGAPMRSAPKLGRSRDTGGVPSEIDFITYDATDNSLIVKGQNATGGRAVEIERGLLEAKGKTDLRITVAEITPANLAALRKAGLKVEIHDGETLVFGTADARTIKAVAKLNFVQRIARLKVE